MCVLSMQRECACLSLSYASHGVYARTCWASVAAAVSGYARAGVSVTVATSRVQVKSPITPSPPSSHTPYPLPRPSPLAAAAACQIPGTFKGYSWMVDVHMDNGRLSRPFVSSLGAFWPGMQALAGGVWGGWGVGRRVAKVGTKECSEVDSSVGVLRVGAGRGRFGVVTRLECGGGVGCKYQPKLNQAKLAEHRQRQQLQTGGHTGNALQAWRMLTHTHTMRKYLRRVIGRAFVSFFNTLCAVFSLCAFTHI